MNIYFSYSIIVLNFNIGHNMNYNNTFNDNYQLVGISHNCNICITKKYLKGKGKKMPWKNAENQLY